MNRQIPMIAGAALAISLMAVPALADTPSSPNCFGAARAAYAKANGSLGNTVGGVGYYASLRAGDNSNINQASMEACGGPAQPPG